METEKTAEDKKYELSEKQMKMLKEYLSIRLGMFGVRGYELKLNDEKSYTYKQFFEQEIELKNLGIFGLALKKCKFVVQIAYHDDETIAATSLSYTHLSDGQNGCDMSIKVRILTDQIVEVA